MISFTYQPAVPLVEKLPESRKASHADWVLSKQVHNPARFQTPLPSNP